MQSHSNQQELTDTHKERRVSRNKSVETDEWLHARMRHQTDRQADSADSVTSLLQKQTDREWRSRQQPKERVEGRNERTNELMNERK
mmetsp:Transcript_31065/g.61244  ORF Transcript_31065/g.61244 Transcript_31065/m.61244 type:complete len:87 (-) Transcript_31065:1519-1779(-)